MGASVSHVSAAAVVLAAAAGSAEAGFDLTTVDPGFGIPDFGYVRPGKKGRVKEVEYEDLPQLMEDRKPGVIRQGPVTQWAALEKWKSREYLAQHVDWIKTIVSDHPTNIYLAPDRSMAQAKYEEEEERQYKRTLSEKSVLNMTMKQLINGMDRQHEVNSPFHYGTTDMGTLCNHTDMCNDIEPRYLLWGNDTHVHGAHDVPPKFHLWVGKYGTASGFHYDSFHNYFVQVVGHKRFIIAKTKDWEKMGLFPYLHPHSRHSQFEVDELANTYKKDVLEKVGFQVVDLAPGDMLYMPPHTFHRVLPIDTKTDELSISVNGWSVSTEALFADYLRNIRVPDVFQESKDEDLRDAAFRMLAIELVVRVKAVMTTEAHQFIHDIFMERYHGPIAKSMKCDEASWSQRVCPDEDMLISEELHNDVGRSVNLLVNAFKAARHTSMIRNEVLDMLIADYIEVLAEFVFEYPLACHHLRCLAFLDHSSCAAEY